MRIASSVLPILLGAVHDLVGKSDREDGSFHQGRCSPISAIAAATQEETRR